MVAILRESGTIAAHVRSAEVKYADAETFNALYLSLNICN
jgi:hypothetical protein